MRKGVTVLSVHDESGGVLTCDLKDILAAIGDGTRQWKWLVRGVDATGPLGEELSSRVELSGERGLLISGEDLWRSAQGIDQTIEGEFWAFPKELSADDAVLGSVRDFPRSRALMGIAAIDSSWFEIYARDASIAGALRRVFKDVRDEPSSEYFE